MNTLYLGDVIEMDGAIYIFEFLDSKPNKSRKKFLNLGFKKITKTRQNLYQKTNFFIIGKDIFNNFEKIFEKPHILYRRT